MELTKENEILLLNKLGNNSSYFSDSFNKETVKQMINNIGNDFPLLLNTGFVQFTKEEITFIKKAVKNYQYIFDSLPFMKENVDKLIKSILHKI